MVAFTTGRPVTGRRGVKAGLKAEADPQNREVGYVSGPAELERL